MASNRRIKAASTINIPDTVGYTTPDEYFALIDGILRNTPGMHDGITISVHCHDDLGMATANTLAKLAAGIADNVLCTTALAFRGPLLVAPAMNWAKP